MRARFVGIWAALMLVGAVARANEQTPTVKESPLARVRAQLTRYDLEPQGTVALLPQLAVLARTLRGPEAAEAAFLRAAVANDLFFLADYLGNEALRTSLATAFAVAPEALPTAIARELTASAQGFYREPALFALAALQHAEPPEQLPTEPSDLRRDARFVRAAATLIKDEAAGGRFAALAPDPCSGQTCAAPYADFDADGRRALVYLQQLSAAAARLERGRGLGDPLFDALAPAADRDVASLRAFALGLPPRLQGDPRVAPQSGSAWPAPDVIVFARATGVGFARVPRVQIGMNGEVVRIADPAPVFPELAAVPLDASDTSVPTRSLDDLVTAMRSLRGEQLPFRVLLVAEPTSASLLPARALVSLRKAGATHLVLATCTKEGALLRAQVRIMIPTVDPVANSPDLKLRVRLGGYSLDVGHGVTDIPRIRDESGLHFDVTALRARAAARTPRSAAVSFMPDVATEQVLLALLQIAPSKSPIDLVIQ
jgi:hypothetical protein